ncbi:MAG: M16 family metallopeptidase [Bacteroidota bacterium]|jgi:predicted Zn-dependent peptidase|nr:insulinase family protein [Ignavibacteria bacterium]MCU7510971.1 insulinase family protein [Ignavibacteria bacterium]MCU7523206.1 insulinase family protein [Ignavibacteria bacterium]
MRILILLFLFTATSFAQTKLEDIKTFTLKNGMKIIILEDHSIPNANMYLFWRVGSRNEYPGITGISHFFEHMMFNGAKKYGPKVFDQVMEFNGGANNAYTTENVTVYTDWFPSNALETIFDLESDRIQNLNFNDKLVESERGVILSERSTGLENSNFEFLNQPLLGVAMTAHPYHWPVIGYESDIKNWSKKDLQNYFKTYYAPNNCVAVISGDVRPEEVRHLAEKYFEPIPPQDPPRKIHTVEPEQLGEKRLTVYKAVSTPNVMVAYHVPQTGSEDFYALDLLNSILSEGKSSRLYNALVDKKQLATEVFTYTPQAFDPFLMFIYAVASNDIKAEALEEAIYSELDKISKEGVTDSELQKAKNQKLMEFYHSMETINGKANSIGTYELFFGDYAKLFSAPDDYNKVTNEDIKRAASKYFRPTNRTVGFLQPEKENK